MSFVIAGPQMLATASSDLTGIGSAIREADATAAPSTTSVVAAAHDEFSAAISKLFGGDADADLPLVQPQRWADDIFDTAT